MASTKASAGYHIDNTHTTLHLLDSLTVDGDIKTSSGRTLRPYTPCNPIRKPITFDAYVVNNNYEGFRGAFTDGVWIYFVPNKLPSSSILSGTVLRIRIHEATTENVIDGSTQNIESLNVAALGNPNLRGFDGGFCDGEYAYLFPSYNVGETAYGYLVRIDITDSWTPLTTVQWLNLEEYDVRLKGFHGGFYDGTYIYLVPSNTGSPPLSGTMARIDPAAANWVIPSVAQTTPVTGVESMDMRTRDLDLSGFWGGFTDGTYGYCVPYFNDTYSGKIVRFPLSSYGNTSALEIWDMTQNHGNARGFRGAVCDGRYAYLIPYYRDTDYHGTLVRLDLDRYGEQRAITTIELSLGNSNWKGFENAVLSESGRYLYLVSTLTTGSPSVVRIDLDRFVLQNVSSYDATAIASGYSGGVAAGGFVFLSPITSGKILRFWNGL